MATINQLRVERLAYYRELKRLHRNVEVAENALDRQIQSILDRRRNVPETDDFQETIQRARNVAEALSQFDQALSQGQSVFNI